MRWNRLNKVNWLAKLVKSLRFRHTRQVDHHCIIENVCVKNSTDNVIKAPLYSIDERIATQR
jgi:hypothetical protein